MPCSRRSWTTNSTMPASAARPMMEVPSGPSTSSGKIVMTSIRIGSANLLGVVGGDDHQPGVEVDSYDRAPQRGHQALAALADDPIHLVCSGAEDLGQL